MSGACDPRFEFSVERIAFGKRSAGGDLDAWREGRFQLVASDEQIAEFKRAARYPVLRRLLPRHAVGRIVNELLQAEVFLVRLRRRGESPDPGDDYLLAMAIAAGADYLVTGDKALPRLKRVAGARVVTPARFIADFGRRR